MGPPGIESQPRREVVRKRNLLAHLGRNRFSLELRPLESTYNPRRQWNEGPEVRLAERDFLDFVEQISEG